MRRTRIALGALGVAGLLWGGWLLVSTQRPDQLLSVAVWLASAVILHDFVLVPVLTLMRRRRHHRDAPARSEGTSEPPG